MSLPPLLLERLKRRKIIREVGDDTELMSSDSTLESRYQGSRPQVSEIIPDQEQEEIIAEDYSDEDENPGDQCEKRGSDDNEIIDSDRDSKHSSQTLRDNKGQDDDKDIVSRTESVLGCPNKYNIYHDCSQYCVDNYSKPENVSPTLEQRKQLALVLRTYPMSNEWTVVYDPGVGTFYFWNIISNLVSWFPPGMNRFVSLPADQIRKSMKEMEQTQYNHQ